VGTSFTGTSFCHATVSGAGITSLVDNGVGNSTLAELDFSLGRALFGGMTTDIFHSPQPEAANLRANIIAFAAREVTRCTLNLEARSTDGTLNLDFEVGTSEPAVLNVWLTAQAEMARLLSASFPVIEAPIPVAVSVPAFPPQGTIGILTTLTTPDAGITCSVFATVNTGPVAAVPEVSAVGIRDQLLQHGTESPDLLCSSSSAGGELECSLQPLKSKERLAPRTRNSRDSMSNSGSDSSQSRSQ